MIVALFALHICSNIDGPFSSHQCNFKCLLDREDLQVPYKA